MPKKNILFFLLLLCIFPFEASAYDFSGENLTYEFGWNGIAAANAVVKIVNGSCQEPCLAASITVTGKKYLDVFWKVRDRIEMTCVKDQNFTPRTYTFYQREGQFNLDTQILHDRAAGLLKSKRTRVDRNKNYKDLSEPSASVWDPLTAILLMRNQDQKEGFEKTIKVFDGKRLHWLSWKVIGKEKIKIGLGEFNALKVYPQIIKSNSKDEKSKVEKVKKVYLWVSDDPAHTILKIESEAFVGKIFAELTAK